jgi:hypothetical protein
MAIHDERTGSPLSRGFQLGSRMPGLDQRSPFAPSTEHT